jgi:pimeloyl-ACP methyl ester carboxylesterase
MTELRTDLVVHHHGRAQGQAPTMLFLHGLTDSGLGWPEAARHWDERFAIVSYDARGHGRSPRFTAEQLDRHPGELMVEDAVRLLEQLDRPVVVGHSLGGAVALCAGVRRPELVRALVLEDPAPLGPGEPVDSGRGAEFLADVRESRAAADDDALLRLRREKHPGWPEAELLPTGHAERDVDVDFLAAGEYKPVSPWPELVAAVTVPTLVVSGDRWDELCVDGPMERGIEEAGNGNVTLVRLPGAGHCVRRDRPAEFYRTVDGWLAGV